MGGIPIAGWFVMENAIKMDDLGYPYFRKPPYTIFGGFIHINIPCWRDIN
jgi:hypothetical protein